MKKSVRQGTPITLLIVKIKITEKGIVQKGGRGHPKALCQKQDRAQGHGLVAAVHDALHTAVLYARALFEPILRHLFLFKQCRDPLGNGVIYSHSAPSFPPKPSMSVFYQGCMAIIRRYAYIFC